MTTTEDRAASELELDRLAWNLPAPREPEGADERPWPPWPFRPIGPRDESDPSEHETET